MTVLAGGGFVVTPVTVMVAVSFLDESNDDVAVTVIVAAVSLAANVTVYWPLILVLVVTVWVFPE
jgi:hypothetical protein